MKKSSKQTNKQKKTMFFLMFMSEGLWQFHIAKPKNKHMIIEIQKDCCNLGFAIYHQDR
jgi:hypothetical protein